MKAADEPMPPTPALTFLREMGDDTLDISAAEVVLLQVAGVHEVHALLTWFAKGYRNDAFVWTGGAP